MRTALALTIVATLVLAACGSSGSSGGADASRLSGTWTLTSYTNAGGTVPAVTPPATLTFGTDGTARGTTGCNRFGGPYETSGSTLKFAGMGMTTIGCLDDAVTKQETAFEVAFQKPLTFSIAGDKLTIAASDGVTKLTFTRA